MQGMLQEVAFSRLDQKKRRNRNIVVNMRSEIRFSKKDCKRIYKIKDSIKAFHENAKEYLKDAEVLFAKKRYNTCVKYCQLSLEEFVWKAGTESGGVLQSTAFRLYSSMKSLKLERIFL